MDKRHTSALTEDDPRTVSRGSIMHLAHLGLDSLYVVLEYPYRDVYDIWSAVIEDSHDRQLHEGILHEHLVLRNGAHGYKLSVWDGDARLYVTDRVDEVLHNTRAQGQGMGMMLQLGPKWLIQHGDVKNAAQLIENVFAQFVVYGVVNPARYAARLNRMDIAMDIAGLHVAEFKVETWRSGWVGYAQQKHFHDAPMTGKLQGLSIGSSSGAVRFKVYDKVAESIKRGSSLFWFSVWDIRASGDAKVARFEWTVKPYAANFTTLQYLTDLTFQSFMEVLNYASVYWGRLCIPSEGDATKTRWELDPLWIEIRHLIKVWADRPAGKARRFYHIDPDIKESYLRSMAGWLAGLEARVGLKLAGDEAAELEAALHFLKRYGYSEEAIHKLGNEKLQLFKALRGDG